MLTVPFFLPFATGLGAASLAAAALCALAAFGVFFGVAAAGFFMTFDGFAMAFSTRAEAATTLKRSLFRFGGSGDPEGAGHGEESELPTIGGNCWLEASRGSAQKGEASELPTIRDDCWLEASRGPAQKMSGKPGDVECTGIC